MANDGNTAEAKMLTLADQTLVMTKSGANRLPFAVLLLFYRLHGRFPTTPEEIEEAAVAGIARQLEMDPGDRATQDMASRTWKRHRGNPHLARIS